MLCYQPTKGVIVVEAATLGGSGITMEKVGEDKEPNMPSNIPELSQFVLAFVRKHRPDVEFVLVSPVELLANGRRIDLSNLYRLIDYKMMEPAEATIKRYFDQLSDSIHSVNPDDFAVVKDRILMRFQPESVFEKLDRSQVTHMPFVNETVIVYVVDSPNATISITADQMKKWKVDIETLDMVARANLGEISNDLDLKMVDSVEGGRAVVIGQFDGYDSARLLMDGLHALFAPRLGNTFYVGVPGRDMFVAMTLGPDEFRMRMSKRVEEDFRKLPYPISPKLFLVTRDGIAGTE